MGNSVSLASTHVVVVGGNVAGLNVAGQLEAKGFKVTIIEPRDSAYVVFGGPRATVESGFEGRVFIPNDRVLKRGTIVRGLVTGVDAAAKTVTYAPVAADGSVAGGAGTALAYDYLVLATGSSYNAPFRPASYSSEASRAAFRELQAAVKAAKKVVVLGGGPSGIELAGDLKDEHRALDVTLVHGGAALLSGPGNKTLPERFKARLLSLLTGLGVTVRLGEKASVQGGEPLGVLAGVTRGPCSVATDKGAAIEGVDLVFHTTGGKPNTGFLKATQLAGALDADGFIKVAPTYAVEGHGDIFALGDCAGSPDAKAGWVVNNQSPIVAGNIAKLATAAAKGTPAPKLAVGKRGGWSGMMAVTVGRKLGALQTPFGMMLGSGVVSSVKGKDLFTSVMAGQLGYKKWPSTA